VCDGIDDDCDGAVLLVEADADLDAWTVCLNDCADADPSRNPGAPEVCNQLDDDCDGGLPSGEEDADADSWAACEGDCNDADGSVNPGRVEYCRNSVDDDCDGSADGQAMDCLAPVCAVVVLGAPGSDPDLSFGDPDSCPEGISIERPVDVIWGDLAAIAAAGGLVQLGTVSPVDCASEVEGHLFDSLRPDPGTADFVLVREKDAADYGASGAGEPRVADASDCP
jgi:hypothetical protein